MCNSGERSPENQDQTFQDQKKILPPPPEIHGYNRADRRESCSDDQKYKRRTSDLYKDFKHHDERRMAMKTTFLPPETLIRFAELFQSEEDYLRIMGDLCTIREHIENLFQYKNTPLHGNKEHPVFKIASTINELIGELLSAGDYSLRRTPTPYGTTITLYRRNNYGNTITLYSQNYLYKRNSIN